MAKMHDHPLGGSQSDLSHKDSVKRSSKPFATSWSNSRPLANCGLTASPAGKLSPKKLAGVGK